MNCIDEKRNINVSFLGDIMCEHTRLCTYKTDEGYNFDVIFENCKDLFDENDFVIANLETPVAGNELKYSFKDYSFNTPEQILKAISKNGIDMVTTANNHVLDRGIEGIDKTIENITKEGLLYTGTTYSSSVPQPFIIEIKNIKLGILSYTYGTEACYNNFYLKKNERYRVNLLRNQELTNPLKRYIVLSKSLLAKVIRRTIRLFSTSILDKNIEEYKEKDKEQKEHIKSDIRICREKKCDVIIMCLHSGGQFNDTPTKFTKEYVKFLIDAGVDIIIGHHEHIIQNAVFSDKMKVAYCLGNFTSNYGIDRKPFDKTAQCSIALRVSICKTEDLKLCFRFSFTIMISTYMDGCIMTIPLFKLYNLEQDETKKVILAQLNHDAYFRFTGRELENPIPQKEYVWVE